MKRSYSLLTLILLCGIFACSRKEQSPDVPGKVPPTSHPDLKSFLATLSPKPEIHTGDASQVITFTTKEGTVFSFMANSLVDAMGNPVSGTVQFKVTEYNSPEAMITGNVETVLADGGLLESGGTFDIEVTRNGQPVALADSVQYSVQFPNVLPDMGGYEGTESDEGTTQWVRREDWGVSVRTLTQTMFPTDFSFTNLDRVMDKTNLTDLNLKLPEDQRSVGMHAMLSFRNRRVLAYIPTRDDGFETGDHYDVPLGEEVTLVVCGIIDGYLYMYDKTFVIGENETILLPEIEKISEGDFQKKLKELNH